MKRAIREKRSKVFGTKQVLTALNKSAHEESHRVPSSSNPGNPTFIAVAKMGWGE